MAYQKCMSCSRERSKEDNEMRTLFNVSEGPEDTNNIMPPICYECREMLTSIYFTCEKCNAAYYCSTECMTNNWFYHKEACELACASIDKFKVKKATATATTPPKKIKKKKKKKNGKKS